VCEAYNVSETVRERFRVGVKLSMDVCGSYGHVIDDVT